MALNADSRIEANGAAGSLSFPGNLSGNGTLIKQGAGTLTLSGASNSASGGTQIGNGALTVNAGSLLGTGALTMAQTGTNNTALNLNSSAQTVGNLSSSFEATTGTQAQAVNLNGTAFTIVQSGTTAFGTGTVSTLTSTISGSGSVILAAASTGKLTLTGAQTYTGATKVSGGTLVVSGSLTSTSSLTVDGGSAQLGIDNAIASTAHVTLNAGVLAAANHAATFADLTNTGASTLDLGVGSTASVLHFGDSSVKTWSGTLTIANWSGGSAGAGSDRVYFGASSGGLTADQIADIRFLNPTIDGSVKTGSFTGAMLSTGEFVAVPEPETWVSLVGGLGILSLWRRVRNSQS